MKPPRTFQALGHYNFRLFWFGQLVSQVGTWMQTVAQAWLVLQLTHSPLALGTVAAFQFLPILVLTLFAGVVVDRLPKRRILLVTQSVALLQAAALALLVQAGTVQVWHVYALAMVLGTVNSIDNPTRQAFIIEMVGRDDLVNAVALNSTLVNAARVVGPAVGGILIVGIGLAPCFFFNAASFLAVLAGLFAMRPELIAGAPRRVGSRPLAELKEGLSYALRTPAVVTVVILMGAIGTFAYNFSTALPLVAHDLLGLGADGFGGLVSAQGLGSLLAALVVASRRRTSERVLFAGAAGVTALLVALAASRSYPLSLFIMTVIGVSSLVFNTAANSRLQLTVPDELRGRVMSLYTLLFLGTTPIGGLVTGGLAEKWGVQVALVVEAAICAAGVAWAMVRRGAESGPRHEAVDHAHQRH